MEYCANTFRRESISCDGTQTISRQSHTLSTPDRVSDSIGELPLKYGTNTYDQFNSNVLLRPVESALTAGVAVMYQSATNSMSTVIASLQSHLQCRGDHGRALHCRGMPADDCPREAVDHECDLDVQLKEAYDSGSRAFCLRRL